MIYTTGCSAKIGTDASHCTTISDGMDAWTYEEMIGEDGEGDSPGFTINSTNPNGHWNPGHSYVKLTLQMLSTLYKPLYVADGTAPSTWGPYKIPGGDAVTIPYFVVSGKAEDGSTVTFSAVNARVGKARMGIDTTGKKVVTIYSFKCDYLTPSA